MVFVIPWCKVLISAPLSLLLSLQGMPKAEAGENAHDESRRAADIAPRDFYLASFAIDSDTQVTVGYYTCEQGQRKKKTISFDAVNPGFL